MPVIVDREPKAPPLPPQPADLIREWGPRVRAIDSCIELDYSWANSAITICDMRVPNALRYRDLYTSADLSRGEYKRDGDLERRVKAFMEGR